MLRQQRFVYTSFYYSTRWGGVWQQLEYGKADEFSFGSHNVQGIHDGVGCKVNETKRYL